MGFQRCGVRWLLSTMFSTFSILYIFILPFVNTDTSISYEYVTCGSVIKFMNTRHNVRLHSHDIKYGSGSGQQSVTAVEASDDKNSYWQVKGKKDRPCTRGTPIKCGQTIRLFHADTRRNLHSHLFKSPLSQNQEVSAFGEDGDGDDGDYWVLTCSGKNWKRNEQVRLKHVLTEKYLTVTGEVYGRPIHGQREVCAQGSPNSNTYWKAMEGVYIKPNEEESL
ncbi:stromal cell-derived factor 2-like [Anneissia japonica]|uniref:stromal cell-derived factor 2-like n=1 Tax=Anneissia japonica TaxID=1529436 RepID=UPI00142561A5|nr:stromal cell-derived factor 2-like [Anneissia japonica]